MAGDKLKALMEERNIKVEELAYALKCSTKEAEMALNNELWIPQQKLIYVANLLGMELYNLTDELNKV
jgi:transcriptional regulator with XRE-family HTH domain